LKYLFEFEISNGVGVANLLASTDVKYDMSLKLIGEVKDLLVRGGFINFPVVYINRRSVPEARIKFMVDEVLRHRGKVVLNPELYPEDKALLILADSNSLYKGNLITDRTRITHIVDWDGEVDGGMMKSYANISQTSNTEGTADEEYIRTLDIRLDSRVPAPVSAATTAATTGTGTGTDGPSSALLNNSGSALVHWYYHPDSHDEWIHTDEVSTSEPPDVLPTANRYTHSCGSRTCAGFGTGASSTDSMDISESSGSMTTAKVPWRVNCRFIYDVRIYHEWGNEYDYEIDVSNPSSVDSTESILSNSYGLIQTPEQARAIAAAGGNVRGKKKGFSKSPLAKGSAGGRGTMTRGSSNSETMNQMQKEKPDLAVLNLLDNCTNTTNVVMADSLPPTLANPDAPVISIKSDRVIATEKAEADEMAEAARRLGASVAPGTGVSANVTPVASSATPSANAEQGSKKRKLDGNLTTTNTSATPIKTESKPVNSVMLSFPSWFNMDKISAVEVRYLPEFFVRLDSRANLGSDASSSPTTTNVTLQKDPSSYLQVRNFIINLSRRMATLGNGTTSSGKIDTGNGKDKDKNNASHSVSYNSNYLSATECRKLICGDACSILKIHEFLDVFGIINQNVPLEYKPVSYAISSGSGCGPSTNFNMSASTVSTISSTVPSMSYSASGATATGQSEYKAEPDTLWNKYADNVLLRHVLTNHHLSTTDPAMMDWDAVATSVSAETEPKGVTPTLTGAQCLTRFMTMTLAGDIDRTSTCAVSSTSAVDADFIGNCINTLGYSHTTEIAATAMAYVVNQYNSTFVVADASAAESAIDGSGSVNDKNQQEEQQQQHRSMQAAAAAALHGAYHTFLELSAQETNSDSLLTQRIHELMADYHGTRMLVMEEKVSK